jgi:predicted phosphodiesterase
VRYAIISDIHANLEALEAVLEEIERAGADRILSLGDAVGYNPNPNECISILKERGIPSLMGNHDAVAAGLEEPDDFNPVARRAVLWTRAALEEPNKEYLREQPESRMLVEGVGLVHGSLIHRDHYLLSRQDIERNLVRMQASDPPIRLLFFGHTHCQVGFALSGAEWVIARQRVLRLEGDGYYLVNPGSVGQPRDQDPRAAFVIYDTDARHVEFFRTAYDIQTCRRKILSAGLPRELAERLSQGW